MTTRTWLGTDEADPTNFSVANNWSPAGVPGLTDSAEFDDLNNNPCVMTENIACGDLNLGDSHTASFSDGGFILTLDGSGGDSNILNVSADGVGHSFTGKIVLAGTSNKPVRTAQTVGPLDISGTVKGSGVAEPLRCTTLRWLAGAVWDFNTDTSVLCGAVTIQSGVTITGLAGVTINCTTYTSASNLNPSSNWFLTASGAGTMTAGIIAHCDATGSASAIDGTGATDGGNNLNINFSVIVLANTNRFGAFFRT